MNKRTDPVIDAVVDRLLAVDPDAQDMGRARLTRVVELVELLRVERPHQDRLMSHKALADYLRVTPGALDDILTDKPGLRPVIKTAREVYFRAADVFRWLDRLHIEKVA